MDLTQSYTDVINTSSVAVAQHAAAIAYQNSLQAPDQTLLDELKAFYDTEVLKLQSLWDKVKALSMDFFNSVYEAVTGFFESLAADIVKFLAKHGINI